MIPQHYIYLDLICSWLENKTISIPQWYYSQPSCALGDTVWISPGIPLVFPHGMISKQTSYGIADYYDNGTHDGEYEVKQYGMLYSYPTSYKYTKVSEVNGGFSLGFHIFYIGY